MAEMKEESGGAEVRNAKAAKSEKEVKLAKKEKQQRKAWEGFKHYMIETKAELKKIVWPTPKSTVNNTVAVLIFMLIVGVFIWCLDALTSTGFKDFIALFTK